MESYNPLSGQWRALDPFTGNLRGGYATVALGNDIYVTGNFARYDAFKAGVPAMFEVDVRLRLDVEEKFMTTVCQVAYF